MKTFWFSPTDYVAGDASLQISYPFGDHPSAQVRSTQTGTRRVWMGLRLPQNILIDTLTICYGLGNIQSFISRVRIVETSTPLQSSVLHDDVTPFQSATPVCQNSSVGGKAPGPGTALALELDLRFQSTSHRIVLGAVGVAVELLGQLCVNVRDFGAKGDGSDATQGLQSAIDFAASAGGGTVCVPPGLYVLSRAIDLKDNVHLEGSGHHVTTLRLQNNLSLNAAQFLAGEGALVRILGKAGVTVSGLRLDGNKDNNEYMGCQPGFQCQNRQQGIIIESDPPFSPALPPPQAFSRHCVIEDCWIEHCVTDGIHVGHAHHITIRNCAAHDNGIVLPAPTPNYLQCPECPQTWQTVLDFTCNFVPFQPWGIILAGHTEHCIVENCSAFGNPHGGIECWSAYSRYHQIRNCKADWIFVNTGVSGAPAPAVYHTIEGCFVDNRRALHYTKGGAPPCIGFYYASQITIRDCHCVTAFNGGISGRGRGVMIAGNRIERADPVLPSAPPAGCPQDPPFAGINVAEMKDAIISDNTLTGEFTSVSGGAAIWLQDSRHVTVTGNSLRGLEDYSGGPVANPTRGILMQECLEVTVTSNTVSGFRRGLDEEASQDNTITGNILRNNQQPVVAGTNSVYTGNVT